MRKLPLYPHPRRLAVEDTPGLQHSADCKLCPLGGRRGTTCLKPVGQAGGLLVVGGAPFGSEADDNAPMTSAGGRLVRRLVKQHWNGPVAYDHAIRCAGTREQKDMEKAEKACRPYTATVLQAVRPTRVVVLGERAGRSVVGECPPLLSARRAYLWWGNVPVFLLPDPFVATRNRFVARWFEEDLAWALTADPPRPPTGCAEVLEPGDDPSEPVTRLLAAGELYLDTETSGPLFDEDFRLLSAAVCAVGDERALVWDRPALEDKRLRAALEGLLRLGKFGAHNAKHDAHSVQQALGTWAAVDCDTRVWSRMLDSEAYAALDCLSWTVGMGGHKQEADAEAAEAAKRFARALKKRSEAQRELFRPDPEVERQRRCARKASDRNEKSKQWSVACVPEDVRCRYVALDAVAGARLRLRQQARLRDNPPLERSWRERVGPSLDAYRRMERNGVLVDLDRAKALSKVLLAREAPILERMSKFPRFADKGEAELRVSMNSPDQRCAFLYDDLKLPRPEGRRSSDKEALKVLADGGDQVVLDLRAWNELEKLRGTYADGLQAFVGFDGRIHPNIKVDGTRSSRTSCESPNMQSLVRVRSELSKACKDVFVAAPGHRLVQVDASQLELRVGASLSADPVMMEIFASGDDYHARTGRILAEHDGLSWGNLPSMQQKVYRDRGKTFNFALIFQQGDKALARNLKCSREEAKVVRQAILGRLVVFDRWSRDRVQETRHSGEVWTWWDGQPDRLRFVWRIGDQDDEARSHAERVAINGPIQGSANTYKVVTVIGADRWLQEEKLPAKLVLEVHDSVLLEVPEPLVDEVAWTVKRTMESLPPCGRGAVPIVADVEVGPSLGSMEKWAA